MRSLVLSASLLIVLSGSAVAQPDPRFGTNTAMPAGNAVVLPVQMPQASITRGLPSPSVDGDLPSDYLRVAQGALAAGRAREAHEALEMAQTRMLDRSVPIGQTYRPSDNPTVHEIAQALQALTSGDRTMCMQLIQAAISSAGAQAL